MSKQDKRKSADAEQKRLLEQKKAKQAGTEAPLFDPDSDKDTTGKSEAFAEKKVGGHNEKRSHEKD